MDKSHLSFAVISFLVFMLLSTTSSACIGMVASKLHLNISAGSSGVMQVFIFNNCDTPFDFDTGAALYPMTNQTTPNVTTWPKHGTLAGHEQIPFNITIRIPSNATPGTNWTGGAAAMELSNSSIVGGANIQGGVRKSIHVTVLAALPNPYILYEVLAVAAIVVVLIIFFLLRRKKTAKGEKKPAKSQKKPSATKKSKQTRRGKR